MLPEPFGHGQWINFDILPPCELCALPVELAVMVPAQRDSELIADLATERPALREAEVMGIRRLSAANQARVPSDEFDVISITNPAWLKEEQRALINCFGAGPLLWLRGHCKLL
jgi:hypothetical protein